MSDEKGTGGPGKSRLPKSSGKLPRVSVSLPDELKDIIEKEAGRRGVTVSKYVTDILVHTHDENGINIPEPMPGQVDLSPVLNAINVLAGEVRGVKTDVQDMKNIVYALPSGSAAQRGTIQKALIGSPDDSETVPKPISMEVTHSAAPGDKMPNQAPNRVEHSAALEVTHQEKIDLANDILNFKAEYQPLIDSYRKENGLKSGRDAMKEMFGFTDSEVATFKKNGSLKRTKLNEYREKMKLARNKYKNTDVS